MSHLWMTRSLGMFPTTTDLRTRGLIVKHVSMIFLKTTLSFCTKDGVMMWSSSAGQDLHEGKPRSAQIEMASYVLLANFRRGSLLESIELMKWLCRQRTHLGGFGTTQVTLFLLLEKPKC